ncbi:MULTISPECIES: hypothetical protein [unclassified Sphingomonas]|jgi:uncharacterized protein YjbJ (UPF0337 family)|uniref:hypothetical protein n=1 Tax=unclassified Sphingomonas TaxID=196159 RepID=UPI000E103A67|nr:MULTISPECIES: hypothetical protein [unclassified Sphingomonas]AXJ96223.1 hypothetical protein DM480_12680 [Sphingomonas sp. FARSPH]
MTRDKKRPDADDAKLRQAKGAAREAIGKLLGDDAEIRKARIEQAEAAKSAPPSKSTQSNNEEQE